MTLTNTAIDKMQVGDELKDHLVPGLTIRATAGGKSWMLYYRTKGGTQRRPKVGAWGVLSIVQARDTARTLLARVAAGQDPVAEQTAARAEPVMDDLWLRCEAEHWNRGKPWDAEAKRLYHAHVKTRHGKTRVSLFGYSEASGLHQALRDTPMSANRTLAVVSKMLKLARRWQWRTGDNPCEDVRRYPENKRTRYPRPDEVTAIGAALDRYALDPRHLSGVAFTYLMIFSGARPSEIARAAPSQVEAVVKDKETYGVLRIDGKTGRRDVFLPPQAMAVLAKLPTDREHLAARKTVPRRLWKLVRKDVGCADLWFRDWRRGFATAALSSGIPIGQVGELLGHKSTQTTKIYAKLLEDPAHTAAASTAGVIEKMLGGNHARASNDDPADDAGRVPPSAATVR